MSDSVYDTLSVALSTIVDFVKQVNFIVPLPDIMIMIGIDVAIRVFKIAVFAVNWVIRRVADIIP